MPEKSEAAALALAERIRVVFAAAAAEIDGHAVAATVSIGVAASRIGGHDLDGLLGRADSALYQAKEAGRNRVAVFAAIAALAMLRSSRQRPELCGSGGAE